MKDKTIDTGEVFSPYIRVGILHNSYFNGVLRPEVPGRFEDVFIDRKNLNGAPFGMRVVCRIIEEADNYSRMYSGFLKDEITGRGMPKGEIIKVLGDVESNDAAMEGIMISHSLSSEFPKKVVEESENFPFELTEEEISREIQSGRLDIRDEIIVTIDGEDTKDIDDGLSISREGDITVLGVHIADVAHYVRENSQLDKEALKRGCSVYLADRVIPMLPPSLSNNLCSLNPHKPRFALTVRIGFDEDGNRVFSNVAETLIQSNERLTYTQVYNLLSGEDAADESVRKYKDMLEAIKSLSLKLRRKRFENGSIDFDFIETGLKLDADKNVVEVYPKRSNFANHMIEECMIACNEAVSEEFTGKKVPFIYRVHNKPDRDKFFNFKKVAKSLGEKLRLPDEPDSGELQKIIQSLEDKPYKETLMQLILRSMSKAVYSDKCEGHFGLAIKYYSHFTSPIRRYPDLFIHRVIKNSLKGNAVSKAWKKKAVIAAEMSSDAEINAMTAERESVDYKTAQYMQQFKGQLFQGKVTGLHDFGIFVRLENSVEGMVPFRNLLYYYEYSEQNMVVSSRETGNNIRIGDSLTVKIANADIVARRIELTLDESQFLVQKKKKNKKRSKQDNLNVKKKKNKRNK